MLDLGYFALFMVPFGVRYLVFERFSCPPITKHGVLFMVFGADGVLLVGIARDTVGWTAAVGLLLIASGSLIWVFLVGVKTSQERNISMPRNPGNSGHRGYKMATIIDRLAEGDRVVTVLSCGHRPTSAPYQGMSAEEWVRETRDSAIGCRVRCINPHGDGR